jgi:hypothetical protein
MNVSNVSSTLRLKYRRYAPTSYSLLLADHLRTSGVGVTDIPERPIFPFLTYIKLQPIPFRAVPTT